MLEKVQSNEISVLLEVIAQQQAILAKFENQGSEISFCEAYEKWLNYHSCRIAEITSSEYWRVYSRDVKPFFKEYQLKNISANNIESFYELRKQEGVKTNSILRVHANLFTFFTWATKNKHIYFNPMIDVNRPKVSEKFMCNFYNESELKQLLIVAKGNKLYMPILMAIAMGLRRSEIVSLKWSDVDFNHKTITIKRKTTRNNKLKIDESLKKLKNLSSYRTLPLPNFVYKYLLNKKEEHMMLFKNCLNKNYICLDEKGEILLLSYITSQFPKLLAKNGLPRIRFHDLRHSCATLLNSFGYSMKDIQEWLGHADFSTTAKYYTHIDMKNKLVLSENLNAVFTSEE